MQTERSFGNVNLNDQARNIYWLIAHSFELLLDFEFRDGDGCYRNHVYITSNRCCFYFVPTCLDKCLSGEGCAPSRTYRRGDADDLRDGYRRYEHQRDWHVRLFGDSIV